MAMASPKFLHKLGDRMDNKEILRFARIHLHLKESEINSIMTDFDGDCDERKYKFLIRWCKKNKGTKEEQESRLENLESSFRNANPVTERLPSADLYLYSERRLRPNSKMYEGYQVSSTLKKRDVVVKVLAQNPGNMKDARILRKLNPHKHVALIIQANIFKRGEEKFIYIAMEKCSGGSLYDSMCEKGHNKNIDSNTSLELSRQLIDGMRHIHKSEIIHVCLTPDKVLLTETNEIKIADYGLSRELPTDKLAITLSSPRDKLQLGYAAPETYLHGKISQKSDIYSLALTIFFIWSCGKHPFGEDMDVWASNIKNNEGKNLDHLILAEECQDKAKEFLEKMLQSNPDERPGMEEIAKDEMHRIICFPILAGLKGQEQERKSEEPKLTQCIKQDKEIGSSRKLRSQSRREVAESLPAQNVGS